MGERGAVVDPPARTRGMRAVRAEQVAKFPERRGTTTDAGELGGDAGSEARQGAEAVDVDGRFDGFGWTGRGCRAMRKCPMKSDAAITG